MMVPKLAEGVTFFYLITSQDHRIAGQTQHGC